MRLRLGLISQNFMLIAEAQLTDQSRIILHILLEYTERQHERSIERVVGQLRVSVNVPECFAHGNQRPLSTLY